MPRPRCCRSAHQADVVHELRDVLRVDVHDVASAEPAQNLAPPRVTGGCDAAVMDDVVPHPVDVGEERILDLVLRDPLGGPSDVFGRRDR